MAVAPLADGRIVTGSQDSTAQGWVEENGQWNATDTLKGHTIGGIKAITQLADGRLVTGGFDNVRVWAEENGQWHTIAVIEDNTSRLSTLAALGDGRIVISSWWESKARIWTEENGEWRNVTILEVDTDEGRRPTGPISAIAELADGRLVTGSWDKTARLWPE